MKEIGGYIELDTFRGKMLYDNGIKLNCGRNALAYVIKAKKIRNILMPKFMCDSCDLIFKQNNVNVRYYSIGLDFNPILEEQLADEWLYVVNFYGQVFIQDILNNYKRVICDNAQAYFQEPLKGVDTLYTCRKFFGVSDGAILYTDKKLENLPIDESHDRMHFLLGRYEKSASEFYNEYVANNDFLEYEPIKLMSRLTNNILHGIDYEYVKNRRTENFTYLNEKLFSVNKLQLKIPQGAFMYPLYVNNGGVLRKKLQERKIYIPILWPSVFAICTDDELEYDMAKNILPLPVDQRYSLEDMKYLVDCILKLI